MKKYRDYMRDNPEGYWFKRKIFGWGWVPVRWQGWLSLIVALAFFSFGIYIGETDDAPGAAALGALIMMGILFYFGYKKGERPKWQWGISEKDKKE